MANLFKTLREDIRTAFANDPAARSNEACLIGTEEGIRRIMLMIWTMHCPKGLRG